MKFANLSLPAVLLALGLALCALAGCQGEAPAAEPLGSVHVRALSREDYIALAEEWNTTSHETPQDREEALAAELSEDQELRYALISSQAAVISDCASYSQPLFLNAAILYVWDSQTEEAAAIEHAFFAGVWVPGAAEEDTLVLTPSLRILCEPDHVDMTMKGQVDYPEPDAPFQVDGDLELRYSREGTPMVRTYSQTMETTFWLTDLPPAQAGYR